MPDMRHVQSKIGSLENAKHTPGGGKVRQLLRQDIFCMRLGWGVKKPTYTNYMTHRHLLQSYMLKLY